jgi:hypothetical protein
VDVGKTTLSGQELLLLALVFASILIAIWGYNAVCKEREKLAPISLSEDRGGDFVGAHQLIPDLYPFDQKTNFVDLHLDFPVSFEKYVMGLTPYMRAVARTHEDGMMLHQQRLQFLNEELPKFRYFQLILNLYIAGKLTPFKLSLKRNFDITVQSDKPEDTNAALYRLIADVMMPFAYPWQDRDSVDLFKSVIDDLGRDHRAPTQAFMKEIIDTKFLKNLQTACLGIYPKILDAELPLRPVLFLDFDEEFRNNPLPLRISNAAFENHKDLYKDISEIISRQYVLVAGINNLLKRDNHNTFKPGIGLASSGKDFTPKNLHAFADVPFGYKLGFIDDPWFDFADNGADNQLRNAIAHYKADYDEITQTVTYYPRKEGIKQEKAETMSFLQFMRQLLISYRDMHRLHHLIKCLFYLQFIILDRVSQKAG